MIMILCETSNPINWVNFAASIGSILVSIVVIYFADPRTKKHLLRAIKILKLTTNKELTDKTIRSKRIEERKNEIYKSLNDFYEPLLSIKAKK